MHGCSKTNFDNDPKIDLKISLLRAVNKPNTSHLESFIAAIYVSKFQKKECFLINMIRMQMLHLNVTSEPMLKKWDSINLKIEN